MTIAFVHFAKLAVFFLAGRAGEPAARPETLIRLSVSPALVPKPALRYVLLPEFMELNPGNPVHGYLKCSMQHHHFFFDRAAFERREELLAMPLRELPAHELQEYGQSALEQADKAARLNAPDWQITLRLKTDGVSLFLPDVQQLRELARALQVRFRAEVALGRFDQGQKTAKTMFAISRHLSEHPTFIGELVGFAVATVAIGTLEEMLAQPGCPNFYWALTNLPSPLVPIDKGIDGERAVVRTELRDLDDTMPMSAAQLNTAVAYYDKLLELDASKNQGKGVQAFLDARTTDDEKVRAARRRLVENGLPEQRLLRFPLDQLILLDEKRELVSRHDDLMKLLKLPLWQAEMLAGDYKPAKEPSLFADALLPGSYNVRRAARPARPADRASCDTSRHCGSTPRNTMARCRRICARSQCRCPTTRSQASHFATSSMAARLTCAAVRPVAWKRKRPSTSIMS